MELFDKLWDEDSLKQEVAEYFQRFDEHRWCLEGGISKDRKTWSSEDKFNRNTPAFVYQCAWNSAVNHEKDKYVAIRDIAKSRDARLVLDYGCGIGSGVIALALEDIPIMGAEYNKHCVWFLADRIRKYNTTRAGVWDLVEGPPIAEIGSVDFLVCTEVFEHLQDPKSTAEMLVSLLEPGGTAILSWSFVPMPGHLPEHFPLQAPHPDDLLTMGFGKFVQELGMEFQGYSWFNNMIWEKK